MTAQDEIDELARYLCEKDGNDPDALVTRRIPQHANGLIASYRVLETREHERSEAWIAYVQTASNALEWMKRSK